MKKSRFLLLTVVLLSASCHKKMAAPPAAPAPAAAPSDNGLEEGEAFFRARDFARAAAAFESYLQSGPNKRRDQALFRLGLAYELSGRNRAQAAAAFRRLVQEFPQSEWLDQAQVMLNLQAESERTRAEIEKARAESEQLRLENNAREQQIARLRRELEKLKRIDLEKKPGKP